uniref:Uncharacterized protein n=1 Tax=Ananas comosus var. bracteatus TaxID=296719 RepID=A0A6V7QC53_ANACO|nr:unnamed protein product [Ananas comosus var. bracteatus]
MLVTLCITLGRLLMGPSLTQPGIVGRPQSLSLVKKLRKFTAVKRGPSLVKYDSKGNLTTTTKMRRPTIPLREAIQDGFPDSNKINPCPIIFEPSTHHIHRLYHNGIQRG